MAVRPWTALTYAVSSVGPHFGGLFGLISFVFAVAWLSWMGRESWRLWLTNRLANALLTAKRTPASSSASSLRPWQYALERLRLEGVDTSSWTPADRLWRQPAGR